MSPLIQKEMLFPKHFNGVFMLQTKNNKVKKNKLQIDFKTVKNYFRTFVKKKLVWNSDHIYIYIKFSRINYKPNKRKMKFLLI